MGRDTGGGGRPAKWPTPEPTEPEFEAKMRLYHELWVQDQELRQEEQAMREPLDDVPDDPLIHRALQRRPDRPSRWPDGFTFLNRRDQELFCIKGGDPARVELGEGVTWDQAAQCFWNTVFRLVGRPEPFPEADA